VAELRLFDAFPQAMSELSHRLRTHHPDLRVGLGSTDPARYDFVVNATPLGMKEGDPLPMDVERIAPSTFVGEVVMQEEITPFLEAVRAKGCDYESAPICCSSRFRAISSFSVLARRHRMSCAMSRGFIM
jgi:shikimate dehydrogenase